MQVGNPLKMNDWDIKKFLRVIFAIQLATWGVIGLETVGLQIPILRQLICFIYLTFIPGIIILRILKLHKHSNIETLLYTVGLSLATLMITGLLMNIFYPIFGISVPISLAPLIITISVVVLVLCIACYLRDGDFSGPSYINIRSMLSPPTLFLCLIPFLIIFGTYLVNFYQNNILLMFLIVVLSIIVLLIGFDRFIPKKMYPLAIFVVAISLLYSTSLISMYLGGWDIQLEYYFSNLVTENSIWNPEIYSNLNAMLSITMLAPIYSIISNMHIVWVFKIIYPLLFSIVPLGLYLVFQKQTDKKIAFLSVFFFMSISTFFREMMQLARQEIAELFLVLLILLMINKDMNKTKRSFLLIIFGFSLIVSHYGLSYIYMFSLIVVWLILYLMERENFQRLLNNLQSRLNRYKNIKFLGNTITLEAENRTITATFVLLFAVFTITWYMYNTISSAFITIIILGRQYVGSMFEFLNPGTAQGLAVILKETASPLRDIHKSLYFITQFLIVIGILTLVLKRKKMKFGKEYVTFSYVNLIICIAGISIPYVASSLNTARLYHITLIFLAPFCIIGGISTFRIFCKINRMPWSNKKKVISLKALSVFLAIFLLFTTGFIYEIAKDKPTSFVLNDTIDYPCFNEQEVLGAKWLNNMKGDNVQFADANRWLLLAGFEGRKVRSFPVDIDEIPEDSYIYFGTFNIVEDKVLIQHVYVDSQDIVYNQDKIYTSGGTKIYYR